MALIIEQPLTLDSTPAPWANRFASLIATDRKSRWRELQAGQVEKRIADATPVAEPTPVVSTSLETTEEISIDEASTGETATAEIPAKQTPADEEPLPTQSGDAAVQFRAVPTDALPTESGVSSDVEAAPPAEPELSLDAGEE